MRYKDRDALVASLREAADFIEQHGQKLPISEYSLPVKLETWLYDNDKLTARDQLRDATKVLGKASKVFNGDYFDLRKEFGSGFMLEFTVPRKVVCEKVITGTRIIPAQEARPEKEVETYEWVCTDPLLKVS